MYHSHYCSILTLTTYNEVAIFIIHGYFWSSNADVKHTEPHQ